MINHDSMRSIRSINLLSSEISNGFEVLIFLDFDDPVLNVNILLKKLKLFPGAKFFIVCQKLDELSLVHSLECIDPQKYDIIVLESWKGGYLSLRERNQILMINGKPSLFFSGVDYNQSGATAGQNRPRRGRIKKFLLEASAISLVRRFNAFWVILNYEYSVVRMTDWRDLTDRAMFRPMRLGIYLATMPVLFALMWIFARSVTGQWTSVDRAKTRDS